MDNRAYQKKYLEKLLIEEGFFKIKNIKLTEKEKNFKRNYKIAEYSEETVNNFLNFIIDLKGDVEISKLVVKDYIENKEAKDKNRMFYNDLLKGNLDINIYNFLAILLEKIEITNSEKNLIKNFMTNIYNEVETIKNIKASTKYRIRRLRMMNIDIGDRFKKIPYEEKIKIVKENLEVQLEDFKSKCNSWIEDLSFERIYHTTYYGAFIQLVIYDILHYSISKDKRDSGYKKILDFFNVFAKKIKKISKKPEVVSSIYIDFFKFISLRETLLMDRCKLELGKSLEKNIFNNIEELDKETLFKSMILRKLEKFDNGEIKDEVISGMDFIEIESIRNILDSNTGLTKISKCRKLVEGFKLIESDISEILYNTRHSKNTFKDIYKKLEIATQKFPFLTQESLQLKKALIRNVEKDKTKVLGRQLKSLVFRDKYKELCKTKIIQANIRIRVTKGLYEEKGIPESFLRSNKIESKINEIFINICSLKNEKLRNKCMLEFSEEFFKVMTEINKNNKVVFLNIPTIKIEIKKNEISEDIQKNSQIFWKKYCKEMNS